MMAILIFLSILILKKPMESLLWRCQMKRTQGLECQSLMVSHSLRRTSLLLASCQSMKRWCKLRKNSKCPKPLLSMKISAHLSSTSNMNNTFTSTVRTSMLTISQLSKILQSNTLFWIIPKPLIRQPNGHLKELSWSLHNQTRSYSLVEKKWHLSLFLPKIKFWTSLCHLAKSMS